MAFWSTETLRRRVPAENLISDYHAENVKHSAYELAIGAAALVTADGKPQHKSLSVGEEPLEIPPGQFGLLLTEEVVRVPSNAIAFISIRASIKFRGLVNVSGFHVDPGYSDKLKFSIYNAGGRSIYVSRGDRIFMIWYADLDQESSDPYKGEAGKNSQFTSADYNRMEGEVASPGQLKKELDELRKDVQKESHKVDTWAKVLVALLGSVLIFLMKEGCSDSSKHAAPPVAMQQRPSVATESIRILNGDLPQPPTAIVSRQASNKAVALEALGGTNATNTSLPAEVKVAPPQSTDQEQ
jgi:dCTP deaminase